MGRNRLPFGCLVILLCLIPAAHGAQVNVFAAASLTDSLKQIGAAYAKQSGDKVVFNFGASSFLARQIEEGAPADIFFSADEAKMDQLDKKNLLVKGTRTNLISNSLVIVVASDSTTLLPNAHGLTNRNIKRLALADPKTVPAGIYAKEYLSKLRLWPALEPKVVPTDNVRAALAAVESGNVEAGIVYKTDAAISKRVKVTCEVPRAEGPAISYPVALLKEAKHAEAARRFLDYLNSPDARRIFSEFGFIILE